MNTGGYYAVKVMNKSTVQQGKMIARVKRERKILSATSQYPEMFVRLHSAFQTNSYLFLVMDFVQGGDCLSLIAHFGSIPEKICKLIVAEVIVAVKFLHAHGG